MNRDSELKQCVCIFCIDSNLLPVFSLPPSLAPSLALSFSCSFSISLQLSIVEGDTETEKSEFQLKSPGADASVPHYYYKKPPW